MTESSSGAVAQSEMVVSGLWENAFKEYKSFAGRDLLDHPLRPKLESCTSIDGVISVLESNGKQKFKTFRKSGHKFWAVMELIGRMLSVVIETSGEVATAKSVPGGKAIFVAVGRLLQATRGVSDAYDAIEKVFARLEHFFKRLEIHLQTPTSITRQLKSIFENTLVEALKLTGLLTKYIYDTVAEGQGSRVKRVLHRSVRRTRDLGSALLDRSDAKEILEALHDLTNEEQLAVAAEVHLAVHAIGKDVRDLVRDQANQEGNARQTASQLRAIVNNQIDSDIRVWLNPPDPALNHDRVRKAKQSGTCDWIFGEKFRRWKRKPNGVYWLHGSPGSGKSVLCSTIIEKLISEKELIAYFYFDFRDSSKQSTIGLLTSLAYQLATCSASCYDILKDFHARNKSSINPREEMLADCLVQMLCSCDRVFIVLDALDEYPVTSRGVDLLPLLDSLIGENVDGLRLLMTSRLEKDIKTSFSNRFIILHDMHKRSEHTDDIERYIAQTLSQPSYSEWSADIKKLATEVLLSKSQGMFLWVYLQLRDLQSCRPIDVERALDELPTSLDATYERILRKFCSKKQISERIRRIFECVAFGRSDLSIEGLAEIFAVDFTGPEGAMFRPELRPQNPASALLDSCSGLIHIVDVQSLSGIKQQVQFTHFTVQEYLLSSSLPDDLRSFALVAKSGHATLAQMCLAILTSPNPASPLQRYIINNLGVHALHCSDNAAIEKQLSRFLHPDNSYFTSFLSVDSGNRYGIGSYPLYWAASAGLVAQIDFLLDFTSTNIDARCDPWGTALCAAVGGGHFEAVKLLVNRGAAIEASGTFGTPLCCAAQKLGGCKEVVSFLLDHGACVHAQGKEGRTALHEAIRYGGRESDLLAILLLDHGSDVNAVDEGGQTPLHYASEQKDSSRALLLLGRGAAVDAQDNNGQTPLHATCRDFSYNEEAETVAILLEHGAIIDSPDKYGDTPLHIAAASGYDEAIYALLECGADVDTTDHHGYSPFCLAIKNGNTHSARLLIEYGACSEVSLTAGWTFLHTVASKNGLPWGTSVFDELLSFPDIDLDFEARTDCGQTALLLASASANQDAIRYLIEHGANINATDSNGFRAIDYAAVIGHVDTIQLILECGGDSWTENGPHGTFMHIALRAYCVHAASIWESAYGYREKDRVRVFLEQHEGRRGESSDWWRRKWSYCRLDVLANLITQARVAQGERMMRRVRRYRSIGCMSEARRLNADVPTIESLERDSGRIAFAMQHFFSEA